MPSPGACRSPRARSASQHCRRQRAPLFPDPARRGRHAEIYAFSRDRAADASLLGRIRARASPLVRPRRLQYGRWLLLRKGPEEVAAWLRQALPGYWAATPAIIELQAEVAASAKGTGIRCGCSWCGAPWGPVVAPGLDLGFGAPHPASAGIFRICATQVWEQKPSLEERLVRGLPAEELSRAPGGYLAMAGRNAVRSLFCHRPGLSR